MITAATPGGWWAIGVTAVARGLAMARLLWKSERWQRFRV